MNSHVVRRVDAVTGDITTYAGDSTPGFSGDDGQATSAQLNGPYGLAFDSADNLFIADSLNDRIRRVDAVTGVITTYAGGGASTADGIAATSAALPYPYGVEVDASGNLYVAVDQDITFQEDKVRVIDATTQIITTYAGNGTSGYGGDGGPATSASLAPIGLDFDNAGNLLIGNEFTLRQVNSGTNIISTLAGTSVMGFNGDGQPALYTDMSVGFLDMDSQGNIYFGDLLNERVRRIDADTQVVTTVAGTGTAGYNGDDIPASTAQLNGPVGVLLDDDGNLYIVEQNGHRIRMLEAQTAEVNAGDGFNWRVSVHNTGTVNTASDGGRSHPARLSAINRDLRRARPSKT